MTQIMDDSKDEDSEEVLIITKIQNTFSFDPY
jgi:hypothetical protein